MQSSKDKISVYDSSIIQRKIYTIRGKQVMLDSDLAELYSVETKLLNRAVKRNINRFPQKFRFQITEEEFQNLRFQFGASNKESSTSQKRGGRRYLPYVFTEQGVSMLSAVLRSETAVQISILIIDAFVEMRKFLIANASLFRRIDNIERQQLKFELETKANFDEIFTAMQTGEIEPKQGIFFDGQIFDAHKFVSSLVRKAKKSILLIDNYIDESVLDLLTKKRENVSVTILTKRITKSLSLDEKKFNAQYPSLKIKTSSKFHDRFLIIDEKEIYHFGASLKDLGKKWFAFSKFDKNAFSLFQNIES